MLIIRLIILLVIVSPITVLANSELKPSVTVSTQQNNQNPAKNTSEQSYKDKYSSKHFKTTLKEIVSQYQNQNTKNKGDQDHYWYDTFLNHPTEWLMVLFNLLLVVVTGFLVCYTFRLWKATAGLWDVADKQLTEIKASVIVADEAAKAANRSAQLAEDAMISGQRAFMFINNVIPIKTNTSLDNGRSINWKITLEWKNTGNTPTKHMLCHANFNYFPEGIPDDYDYPDLMQEKPRKVIVGPKGFICHTIIIPFPVVYHPHLIIYMWAWADYNDVFKDTPRHRTEYCWKVKMLETGVPQFDVFGKHNGHDDECYRKPSPYTPPT
ncbi:MAG: hypothetical protein ACYDIC_17835 [Desulfobaccales bacterium]